MFRFIYKIHTWLGIFILGHILILASTGAILLWRKDISTPKNSSLESSLAAIATTNAAESYRLQKIENYLLAHFPQKKILALFRDHELENIIQARLADLSEKKFRGSLRLKFDDGGNIISSKEVNSASVPWSTRVMDFALKLHREFALGSKGKYYVGLIGFIFLATLLTGLSIYPQFSRGQKLVPFRTHGHLRLWISDLHKFLALSVLSWAFLVGLTGGILAFNDVFINFFLKSQLQQQQFYLKQNFPYTSVFSVQQELQRKLPNFRCDFISFPDNEFSLPKRFVVLLEKNVDLSTHQVQEKIIAILDGYSGGLLSVVPMPWYIQMLFWAGPLHFGNYAGFGLKIFWLVMTLLTLFMAGSGLALFTLRKKIFQLKSRARFAVPHKYFLKVNTSTMLIVPPLLILTIYLCSGQLNILALSCLMVFTLYLIVILGQNLQLLWPMLKLKAESDHGTEK